MKNHNRLDLLEEAVLEIIQQLRILNEYETWMSSWDRLEEIEKELKPQSAANKDSEGNGK